ncbi:PQQ-like domain-containing protein [Cellulosimicrobium aquatile]|uniref:PQQ-like domain-containing protein n=1 Tax=Cellulosimicrobium aquatile TaxID=1612203 RepID=A0A1N6Q2Q2_9MICO|nr:PQQ-binding-like beta-propeller repeat protein [Cellulosimicrobium aquatile]SIQ10807.1 PQQ-like domain-containing protein [Cellulosimicrobium aquatile]
MPLRRRDARDRLTFELVESEDVDADDDALGGPGPVSPGGPRGVPSGATVGTTWTPGVTAGVRAALGATDGPAGPDGPPGRASVDDDPAEDDPAESDAAESDPAEGGPPRRGRPAAVVAGVAAGVALVLGGMLAVDAWQGRADVERLRAAPGGLEPLPDAPVERWTADVEVSGGLALLPGAVVTVEDGTAVARSLDDGAERWRVDVGAHASCGGQLLWSLPFGEPASTLVCVAPSSDAVGLGGVTDLQLDPETGRVLASDWAVTVLAADGEVLGRRDTTSAGGAPIPGTDGTLLRAQRVGEVPAGDGAVVEQDVATSEVADLPLGRPAVVRVEDALTGDTRWEADVPFVEGSGQCVGWTETDGTETIRAELENLWAATETHLVRVEGCGVTAWFTPGGERLDDQENPLDGVVALADGTYYRDPSGYASTWGSAATAPRDAARAVLAADGAVRWEPPGPILVPRSSDGSDAPLLARSEGELVAFDGDGSELWRSSEVVAPEAVLVATHDTVVVSGGSSTGWMTGLDATTGTVRWSLDRETVEAAAGGSVSWMDTAYTDGRRAILLAYQDDGRTDLLAIDLADGHVAWSGGVGPEEGSWPVPLQGRLLRIGQSEIARLG